jgi:hypothetical protein
MNVLIDANVVFDVVEKRQPHYAASNQVLCLPALSTRLDPRRTHLPERTQGAVAADGSRRTFPQAAKSAPTAVGGYDLVEA